MGLRARCRHKIGGGRAALRQKGKEVSEFRVEEEGRVDQLRDSQETR